MSDYWEIRNEILKAIRLQDDETLRSFSITHPVIFNALVNQAKKALRRGKRG